MPMTVLSPKLKTFLSRRQQLKHPPLPRAQDQEQLNGRLSSLIVTMTKTRPTVHPFTYYLHAAHKEMTLASRSKKSCPQYQIASDAGSDRERGVGKYQLLSGCCYSLMLNLFTAIVEPEGEPEKSEPEEPPIVKLKNKSKDIGAFFHPTELVAGKRRRACILCRYD